MRLLSGRRVAVPGALQTPDVNALLGALGVPAQVIAGEEPTLLLTGRCIPTLAFGGMYRLAPLPSLDSRGLSYSSWLREDALQDCEPPADGLLDVARLVQLYALRITCNFEPDPGNIRLELTRGEARLVFRVHPRSLLHSISLLRQDALVAEIQADGSGGLLSAPDAGGLFADFQAAAGQTACRFLYDTYCGFHRGYERTVQLRWAVVQPDAEHVERWLSLPAENMDDLARGWLASQ